MLDAQVNSPFLFSIRLIDGSGSPATAVSPTITISQQPTNGTSTTYVATPVSAAAMFNLGSGRYGYWWTPTIATAYDYDIDETTIPSHFFGTVLVGNSTDLGISTHILALSNKGQDVILSSIAGSVLFTTTLTLSSTPVASTTVRFFNATNITDNAAHTQTLVDFTFEVAQAATSTTGGLSVQLNPVPGYFAMQFIDPNGGQDTQYIKYVSGSGTWTVTTTPQNP